jgi:DNA-binding NarL/FixJ family response regulator
VAIVSGSENRDDVIGTISTGLAGFIPKNMCEDEIVAALHTILDDRIYVPRFVSVGAAGAGTPPRSAEATSGSNTQAALDKLTPRQRDVLASLTRGLSNKQIAHELDIAEGTVKIHLAALFAHFGARNRTELVARVHALDRVS